MSEVLKNKINNSEDSIPIMENNLLQEGGLLFGFGTAETISNIATGLQNLSKIKRRFLYKLLLDWTQQKTLGFLGKMGRIQNAIKRIEAFEKFIEEIYKHEIGREDNYIDIQTFNAYKFNKQAIIIMSLAYILVKTSSIGDKNISEFAIELERLMTPADFKKPPTKDKETLEYKNEKRRKRQTDTYAINLVKKYVCTPNKKYDNIVEVAQDLWQQILDKEVKVKEAEAERKKTEKALEDRKKKAQEIINTISKDLPGLTETRTKDALEKTKIRTALQEIVNRYYKILSDTDDIALEIKEFKEKQADMEIKDINIRKKQIIDNIFKILREARELLDYLSSVSLQGSEPTSQKEISNTLEVLIQNGGSYTSPVLDVTNKIETLKTKINTNVIDKLKIMVTEINKTSTESVEQNLQQVITKLNKNIPVQIITQGSDNAVPVKNVDALLNLVSKHPKNTIYFHYHNGHQIIGDGSNIYAAINKETTNGNESENGEGSEEDEEEGQGKGGEEDAEIYKKIIYEAHKFIQADLKKEEINVEKLRQLFKKSNNFLNYYNNKYNYGDKIHKQRVDYMEIIIKKLIDIINATKPAEDTEQAEEEDNIEATEQAEEEDNIEAAEPAEAKDNIEAAEPAEAEKEYTKAAEQAEAEKKFTKAAELYFKVYNDYYIPYLTQKDKEADEANKADAESKSKLYHLCYKLSKVAFTFLEKAYDNFSKAGQTNAAEKKKIKNKQAEMHMYQGYILEMCAKYKVDNKEAVELLCKSVEHYSNLYLIYKELNKNADEALKLKEKAIAEQYKRFAAITAKTPSETSSETSSETPPGTPLGTQSETSYKTLEELGTKEHKNANYIKAGDLYYQAGNKCYEEAEIAESKPDKQNASDLFEHAGDLLYRSLYTYLKTDFLLFKIKKIEEIYNKSKQAYEEALGDATANGNTKKANNLNRNLIRLKVDTAVAYYRYADNIKHANMQHANIQIAAKYYEMAGNLSLESFNELKKLNQPLDKSNLEKTKQKILLYYGSAIEEYNTLNELLKVTELTEIINQANSLLTTSGGSRTKSKFSRKHNNRRLSGKTRKHTLKSLHKKQKTNKNRNGGNIRKRTQKRN
jgi:hypothetical protein